jgi:hypothetical protein
MRLHANRHALGGYLGRAKTFLGHMDTGIRIAHAVHNQVKDKLPESKISKAASKGFTDYEKARESIRLAANRSTP